MSIRANRSSFRSLFIVAVGLIGTAFFAIGLTIWWLRSDALRDAFNDADNLAIVLADQFTHAVRSIDLVLNEIRSPLERLNAKASNDPNSLFGGEDTLQLLMEHLSRLPQAERISLVDKDGRLVNTTFQFPFPEINVSDRQYFQYFRNNDDKRVHINHIFADRIAGDQLVVFSKRINGTKNEFIGVVLVGIRLTYFEHIYSSLKSMHDRSFSLMHRDSTVIVRFPGPNDHAGEKMLMESPWHRMVSQGGGHFRSPGYFDGIPRLVAVHPIFEYPIVINVTISEYSALANWRNIATYLGFGTFLTLVCSIFLLKTLSDKFQQLATASAQTNAALNNMSQGLIMFDSSSRLVVFNQRYLEMYSLSSEIIGPGSTLREILDQRVAGGSFCADDIERYISNLETAISQGKAINKITNLRDGRVISIKDHPMDGGGWVATHEDVTEEKRAEERIAYAAHVDALTGLPNRKLFCEQLEEELKRTRRGERLAVLYLDLDHLKRVNDTLGHPVGDKLLLGVADRLRGCIRDIDMVARLSGDEFAIIQKLLDQPSDAAALAMRVSEAILEPFDLDGHQVKVNISVGISIAPDDATELDELLRTADIALYEAKNTGRGTYCFFEPRMNTRMQERGTLERDLHSALANGEFELFYQPGANLEDNKINSFEALLRWRHRERGMISPAEFIPIAEETGLIVPLGEWVLRTACADAATWPDDIHVAVNVSSIQLTNKNLVNVIIGAIASAGIPPNRLELEITESVLIQNTSANLATLKSVHELGVQFAMDDFGTGYSSLGYLLSFPFHRIKIDRSFIFGLADKHESRAIVRATADLARSLSMRVTAEGVETEQQMQQVRILGCTEMQGYLLSPPRPAAEILQFFRPRAESLDSSIAVDASASRRNSKMCRIRPDLGCSHWLTQRECDVLKGIVAGESAKESACQLNISPRMVRVHRGRITQKFGAETSADLVRVMLTKGCSPACPDSALRYRQSPDIKAAVTSLARSVKEPRSDRALNGALAPSSKRISRTH